MRVTLCPTWAGLRREQLSPLDGTCGVFSCGTILSSSLVKGCYAHGVSRLNLDEFRPLFAPDAEYSVLDRPQLLNSRGVNATETRQKYSFAIILALIVCADYIPEDVPTGHGNSATESSSGKQLIFVVEDDPDIGRLICHCLYMHGYATRWFAEPSTLMAQANASGPALILLDIMLPGTDGFELCRQIRQSKTLEECRVIFLSAKTGESECINGLELGADAYITKPFSPRELVARVRTVLRRTPGLEPTRIAKFGRLEIDSLAMTVSVDGKLIKTTTREFRLLDYLAHHPARVFTAINCSMQFGQKAPLSRSDPLTFISGA